MKKTLVVFAALAMVFCFTMSAAADPCIPCNKCDLVNIECPDVQPGQTITYECSYFDWETASGSCQFPEESEVGKSVRNCAALFYVCECPGFTAAGETVDRVGVQMSIIQGDGVYFRSDDGGDADVISIEAYESNDDYEACFRAGTHTDYMFLGTYKYYLNKEFTQLATAGAAICGTGGIPPVERKAKAVRTETTVTTAEIDATTPYWIVDIPELLISQEYIKGQVVKVKVDLIGSSTGGFCSTCNILCTCTYDVGILCCDYSVASCIYFPYVKVLDPWACGVVVTLTDTESYPVADTSLMLELTDSTGAKFTATLTAPFTSGMAASSPFCVRVLNAATMAALGWAPTPGTAMLKVIANAPIDGYTFLTNGDFGGSVLARGCRSSIYNSGDIMAE